MNTLVPGTEQYDENGILIAAEMETPAGRQLVADPLTLNIAQKAVGSTSGGFGGAMPPPAPAGEPLPDAGFIGGGGLGSLFGMNQGAATPTPPTPVLTPMPPPPFRGPPIPPGLTTVSGNQDGTPGAPPGPPSGPSFSGGGGFVTLRDGQETVRRYDPALEKEQRDIVRRGQAAIKSGLEAELAMSKVAEQNAQAESQLLQTQINADNERRDAQRQAAEASKRAADAALAKYEGMELEPNRIWANSSTGDKMLAGLSMIMGAWGNVMMGEKGQNPAIAAIEKAMEKDLEVQKAMIAKGKDVAGAKANLYKDLLAAHRDEDAAAAGVRELAWKGLASRARAAEAKVKDPAIKAKYEAAAVELEAKANEEALKRSERSIVTSSKQVPLATSGSTVKFNDDIVDAGKSAKITAAKNVHQKADHLLKWAQGLSPQDREKMFGFIDKPADELASWLGITQDPDYVAGKISRENLKKMALFRLSGAGVPVAEDVKFDAILPNFKNYDNFVTGMAKFRDEMADEYNVEINTAVAAAAHPERKRMIMMAFPLMNSRSQTEALKDKYRTK